jgi:hypothetical protein
VRVGARPYGRPIAPDFVGLSIEYNALRAYTGKHPDAIDPVLLQLIRNLAPGQRPVLRIGGDSTDSTWWPVAGMARPPGITNTLSAGWLAAAKALAADLGARLILGVNLKADSTTLASAEARALVRGIGRRYIQALEIGNEPEEYGRLAWYRASDRRPVYARPSSYGLPQYIAEFERLRAALPPVPLAAPATGFRDQLRYLPQLLKADPRLGLVTLHRYPLNRCFTSPGEAQYPTLANLLRPNSSYGLMWGLAPWVAYTHAHGATFRVDELNSIACGGEQGLSDTFGSALWALDTLFQAARAGVDGVNLHMFPGAYYSLFSVSSFGGRWQAVVHPEYYAALLFSEAAGVGSRLLPVSVRGPACLRAWATTGRDGRVRIVLINDGTSRSRNVLVRTPPGAGRPELARLQAPSVGASEGVTLAGQTFGASTSTGLLTRRTGTTALGAAHGPYTVALAPASAVLLTFSQAPAPRG